MPPEQDLPLESLQKRIYSNQSEPTMDVPAYSQAPATTPYGWQAPPPPIPPKKKLPWTIQFLVAAGTFLVVAGIASVVIMYMGARAVKNDKVEISIPPSSGVASGDTVPLVITIKNNNPTAIKDATLNVALPDGTRKADTNEPMTQYNEVLGSIPAGDSQTRTIMVKLFGEQGKTLTIPMKVQYHVEGSNALYQSKTDYTITVSSSPLSVQVQALAQTPSNQPFTLTVYVRSNASSPVENVALAATYPLGFSVQNATPAPTGTNYFTLGTINPGEQKIVQIRGVLVGQGSEDRVFKFTAGSANPDGTSTLGNSYAQGNATIAITHPFLNVALSFNNDSRDPIIVKPGQYMNSVINWKNTLPTSLSNASVKVSLTGNALAPGSIVGGTGFYRSTDSSVIFDSTTNSTLASLPAGSTGVGSFAFAVKSASALQGVQNPTVTLSVSVSGLQGSQGGSAQTLTSTLTRTVKVGTTVSLSSALAKVSGPVPPAVDSETVYTVTLTAKNTVNSVGAAKVTATIPSYVRYVGQASSNAVFNPDNRTLTWTIGDLTSGGTASAHFQVGITPSASQRNSSPTLINEQAFTGFDRFTQENVTAASPRITTELPGSASSGTVH